MSRTVEPQALTPEALRDRVRGYVAQLCAGDVDALVSLFAEDATMEDPVGSPPHVGREALREFYTATAPSLQVEIVGPICVAGREVAFPILARVTFPGQAPLYLDAVDVMEFDDGGRIRSARALWNPVEMRPNRS